MTPPQVTVSVEDALRLLSNAELANAWVACLKAKEPTEHILQEFRYREWQDRLEYEQQCFPI